MFSIFSTLHRNRPTGPTSPVGKRWLTAAGSVRMSLLLLLAAGLVAAKAEAQTARLVPDRRQQTSRGEHLPIRGEVDTWTLQTIGEVVLDSPIVRLQDIVLPVGVPDEVWENLGASAVTLVPTDGRRLTIERQRLLDAVHRRLAPQNHVRWTGPELIYVQYRGSPQALERISSLNAEAPDSQTAVHKVSAEESVGRAAPASFPASDRSIQPNQQTSASEPADPGGPAAANATSSTGRSAFSPSPSVSPDEVLRLTGLLESAIATRWPEVAHTYAFAIDPDSFGLGDLRSLRTVESVQLNEPIRPGSQLIQIAGSTFDGSVTAQIRVRVETRTMAVYVRHQVRRGERIGRSDLELRPTDHSEDAGALFREIESLVGMEARTSLRPGRPVRRDDVKAATVIHRNDQVEVRVAGGGIVVRSSARSLQEGAMGELIEVETARPRSRLMARVVGVGEVEITTRAPQLP